MAEIYCAICNNLFNGKTRAKYCINCRITARQIVTRKYKENGAMRKLGSLDKCVICQKDYIVLSGLQKYCKDCAAPTIKEIDKKQGLEYYIKNKNKINPARNEKRRIKRKCAYCNKPFEAATKQLTCSTDCKKAYINEKWRKRYHDKARKE